MAFIDPEANRKILFVMNMVIASGLTLLLADLSQERFAQVRRQVQRWKEERVPDLRSH
jgi:hypothetical protein